MASELPAAREPTVFKSRLLLFFVAILLFIALLCRRQDLSLLAMLVLLLIGAAKAWSVASLTRIRCASRVSRRRVFPGESVSLEAVVENAKLLPARIRLGWSLAGALEPASGAIAWHEVTLWWHQRARCCTQLVARRRGVYRVGPPCVESGDVFGIFRREKRFEEVLDLLVYPRLVPVRAILPPRRDPLGAFRVKLPVEDPAYVLGTRDYHPSRPSRHIHWKASARRLRLQEKIFEPSGQGKVLFALEVAGFAESNAEEAFERTLEVVASLSVQLESQGYAVGLLSNAVHEGAGPALIPAARGPRQLPSLLEALARMRLAGSAPLEEVIRRTSALHRGLGCLLFSHRADEQALRLTRLCRARGVPLKAFVWKPAATAGRGSQSAHLIDEIRVREGGNS